jgi:hypothetical protein
VNGSTGRAGEQEAEHSARRGSDPHDDRFGDHGFHVPPEDALEVAAEPAARAIAMGENHIHAERDQEGGCPRDERGTENDPDASSHGSPC